MNEEVKIPLEQLNHWIKELGEIGTEIGNIRFEPVDNIMDITERCEERINDIESTMDELRHYAVTHFDFEVTNCSFENKPEDPAAWKLILLDRLRKFLDELDD